MNSKLLFFVMVLLSAITTQAQQVLTQTARGRIIDEQSQSPVIGATIVVKGLEPMMGTITDVDGYFSIPDIPIGRHTLIISSVGYERKQIPELLFGTGKQVIVNVSLVEDLVQMEEVVVVADAKEKGKVRNELATVSAISLSVEETSRYAATFDDPARAALSQPGVTGGEDDLLNEIVIRGNTPRGILWRLEGVEIPNPNHFGTVGSSAGGISMLSGNVLSNSDFFTGAFPAQYGNATSGIFDLKMRNGNFDRRENAFQAGLLGIAAASEGPVKPGGKASYVANYRYSTLGLLDKVGLQILGEQEEVTFQDLSFKVNLPTTLGTFSIWGLGGANSYGYKADPEAGDWWHEEASQEVGIGGVTHIGYLSENTFLESSLSVSGYSINNYADSLSARTEIDDKFIESSLRFSSFVNHKFDSRNTLRVGGVASFLNYNMRSNEWMGSDLGLVTFLDDKGSASMYQGFANWQHRLTEGITLNGGVHTTHFSLNGDTYVEPRVGFRGKVGFRKAITGGFGLHSRKETLALYAAQQTAENGTVSQVNKNLGFTKAIHGVLGFESMLAESVRLKSEIYYQHLYEVPVWGDMATDDYFDTFSMLNSIDGFTSEKLVNDGLGRNYGVELTVEKFFNRGYYFMATTSVFQSLYTAKDGIERNTRFNSNYILNLVGGNEIPLGNGGNNTLGLNGRFIVAGGKREAPILVSESSQMGYTVRDYNRNFETQMDPYLRFDIGISYRINKPHHASIVALNVQNMTGRENEYGRYYSGFSNSIVSDSQVGFFPNLSYRIEF